MTAKKCTKKHRCTCKGLVFSVFCQSKGLFTWSGGPRSSGVGFFCFVSPRAWKQKKPNPTRPGSPTQCKQALNLLLFCHSRCRRSRRCLSSLCLSLMFWRYWYGDVLMNSNNLIICLPLKCYRQTTGSLTFKQPTKCTGNGCTEM